MHAFLVAQHLLAAEHEGHALRAEHGRLCQQVEADEFILRDAGDRGLEAVYETHIVVAAHIAYHLRGLCGPSLFGVVHLAVVNLRVGRHAGDTRLHTFLLAGQRGQEGAFGVVAEGTAQGIAQLIGEGGYAGHLRDVGLGGQQLAVDGALSGAPSLAVEEDRGVYLVDRLAYGVHRLDVVHAHEVEAESVDVVLINPVFHRLNHELPHQGPVGGRFVAAAGAVAVAAVGILAIIVVGPGALEVGVLNVVGVVVHHIEDDTYAGAVQGLHHLLELAYAAGRVVGIGGVAALRHIVVHRVVAPVVLIVGEACLVDRAEVVGGQYVHGIHPELLQVADGPGLGEGEEFARMLRTDTLHGHVGVEVDVAGDGEVAVVHLVDDEVGGRAERQPLV